MKRLRVLLLLLLLGVPALIASVLAALDTAAADAYLARALPRWAGAGGLRLSLDRLDLEPWRARVTLGGLDLRPDQTGRDAWEVAVERVEVHLRVWQSLLGTPHLELSLDAPRVSGTVPGAGGAGGGEGGGLPRLVLHTLQVSNGTVELRDPSRDLELTVGAVEVGWVQGAGGGSARDVQLRWRGGEERLDRVEFAGTRRFAALRLDRLDLEGPRLRVRAGGRVGPWRLLALDVEGDLGLDGLPGAWVESLGLARFAPLGGGLSLSGRVGGSVRRPEFEGTLQLRDGRFGAVRDAALTAVFSADHRELQFREVRGTSNVVQVEELAGRLHWDDGVWLKARGRAREYRLRPFMEIFFPGQYFPVGLTVDGEFQAEGPLYPELALEARGELAMRNLDVTTGPDGERHTRFALPAAKVRTRLTVGRREITFGPSRVETESMDVDVSGGRIEYSEGMWFSADGEVRSLALARPLLPGWIDARGRAEGQFGGPYRELEFAYDVDLPSVSLHGHDLGRLRGHGEFDLRTLEVVGGHLSGPLGELFADGGVTLLPEGEHAWDLRWEQGDLGAAIDLVRGLGGRMPVEMAGTVASEGRLAGLLAAPEYTGTAELTDLQVDRFHVSRAWLTGRASPTGWRVPRVDLEAYGTRASGRGNGGPQVFDATLNVAGLGVGPFLEEIQVPLPVDGRFAGRVRAGGPYPAARVDVTGQVVSPIAWGIRLPDSDLELALDREMLELTGTALDGKLEARCQRAFGDGALEASAQAREVPWAELPGERLPAGVYGTSVSGTAELQVDSSGEPVARWEGTARGVAWRELTVGEVGFDGSYRAGGVGFGAAAWDRSLRLDALVSPEAGAPVELEVALTRFSLPHLSPLLPVASGTADGGGTALLGWEQWSATGGAERLSALADLELDATVTGLRDPRGIDIPELRIHVDSPEGRPRGRVAAEGLTLEGEVEDLGLARWRVEAKLEEFAPWPLLPPEGPAADLDGRISGQGWLRGEGTALAAAGSSGKLTEWTWRGRGLSNWDWELELLDGRLRAALSEPRGIELNAGWDPSAGLLADLSLREVPLGGWVGDQDPAAKLSGVVEGTGALRWPPQGPPDGELELSDLALRWAPIELANDTPVRVRWDGEVVALERLSLTGEGVGVVASGSVSPQRNWDLTAQGTVDLGTLAEWVPQVERGSGRAKVGLEVHGPWDEPEVRGPVEILSGATLKLAGIPVALEDLDAAGILEGDRRFTLEWLDAQVREGRLHLEGGFDLDQWRPGELRFYGEIRDLDLQWPTQVEYLFDADALVTGTVAAPQIRGEVRLQEFLYSRDINWRQLVLDALDRKPRRVETRAEEGVFVDLAVRGDDGVRVENNVAELELAADLRVRGYLPDPILWGRVDVAEGTVRFLGREYETQQGTVEFLGETRPVPHLDLHAQTQTRDYTVNVDVTGPLDNYQVNLSSVPYLSHTDVVALLTLGRTSQEAQGGGSVTGVEAASILSEGFQEEFQAVGGVFGLDTFHIDPSYSPATQTTVPRFTVGKAVTEELYARYSAAVGAETQQDVELEYTINPRVSLLGTWIDRETQERGSLGGEVRFRFPFR